MNRNKLIDLFISNLANVVLHKILEIAIDDEIIRKHYDKELGHSLEIAKKYREKINPVEDILPSKDIEYIKNKVINKVNSELKIRIEKRSEEHTSELQSHSFISYAVFCLKKKKQH